MPVIWRFMQILVYFCETFKYLKRFFYSVTWKHIYLASPWYIHTFAFYSIPFFKGFFAKIIYFVRLQMNSNCNSIFFFICRNSFWLRVRVVFALDFTRICTFFAVFKFISFDWFYFSYSERKACIEGTASGVEIAELFTAI